MVLYGGSVITFSEGRQVEHSLSCASGWLALYQRWDQVTIFQVQVESQVFAVKSQVKSQVKAGKSVKSQVKSQVKAAKSKSSLKSCHYRFKS